MEGDLKTQAGPTSLGKEAGCYSECDVSRWGDSGWGVKQADWHVKWRSSGSCANSGL